MVLKSDRGRGGSRGKKKTFSRSRKFTDPEANREAYKEVCTFACGRFGYSLLTHELLEG